LLGELGFQSVDELKVAIGGLRDSAARTEAKKLAEQQEREALAIELAKTRQEAERLKKDADQLAGLRDQLRLGRIRAAAIEAGILPDAADLALADLGGVVRWDAQFKELLVHDEQGQPTATTVADLFKAHREKRPYLYQGSGRSGSGINGHSGNGSPRPNRASPSSSLKERLSYGR
jgi:uncharacterized small protein (DUF1192 family)